jgi:ribonucleotide reductase alpha subunit
MDSKMEAGKVTGANISLKLNDDFMKAVIDDSTFEQLYPVNSKNPEVSFDTKAKPLFNKIVHNAWKSAEPGVLFWDTVIKESVSDCYADKGFKTISTNPCLVGDTLVKTTNGDIEIKTLVERFENGENFDVYTYNEKSKEIEINSVHNALLSKKNANIIELILEDDTSISLTPDHKILTEERGWIEASKITTNDTLLEIED